MKISLSRENFNKALEELQREYKNAKEQRIHPLYLLSDKDTPVCQCPHFDV